MEHPPLVEIKQEGKASVYTTDFYFTNKLPSNIAVWSPGENNTMSTGDQTAAADPTLFDTDSLQPREIHLHSWMLYTSQTPILDLTGEHIKTKEDIKATFYALNLCSQARRRREVSWQKRQKKNQQIRVSHLQIVILLMIPMLTLNLKPQSKKDNTILYQDQLQQPA